MSDQFDYRTDNDELMRWSLKEASKTGSIEPLIVEMAYDGMLIPIDL
jgi:hypothetical protein